MKPPLADVRNVPPHSVAAERAVLSAILRDRAALDIVSAKIKAGDFYVPSHATLYSLALDLRDSGLPQDVITWCDALKERGTLELCGGWDSVTSLYDELPTAANAEHYACVVSDHAHQREVMIATARAHEVACQWDRASRFESQAHKVERVVLEATQSRKRHPGARPVSTFAPDVLEAYRRAEAGDVGILTGLRSLDLIVGGLQPGAVVVLGARPSHGKTSLLVTLLRHMTAAGVACGLFSLETPAWRLTQQIVSGSAKIPSTQIQRGRLDRQGVRNLIEGLDSLTGLRLFVDDSARKVEQIVAESRRLVATEGVGLIAIDYAQLVETDRKTDNRTNEVGYVSRRLKEMAIELGVVVLAAAQLSRKVDERPSHIPGLSDLRECGSLEQDADQVWLLSQPARYEEHRPGARDDQCDQRCRACELRGDAYVHVAKNRSGVVGTVRLYFSAEVTEFVEVGP